MSVRLEMVSVFSALYLRDGYEYGWYGQEQERWV